MRQTIRNPRKADAVALAQARYCLSVWGQHVRERRNDPSLLYIGNVDAGEFRGKSDPHPNAQLLLTVERMFSDLPGVLRLFALAHWVDRREWRTDFNRFYSAVVSELACRISDNRGGSIVSATMQEVRLRNMRDREERVAEMRRRRAESAEPMEVAA